MGWTTLKTDIARIIKTNGNQEITGALLQQELFRIVDNVGGKADYAGIATTLTNPLTPDGNVYYLASEIGIYTNFIGVGSPVVISDSGLHIISNISGVWVSTKVPIPMVITVNGRNNSGVTIGKGKVVYISGATGNIPLFNLATTANQDIAQRTFGITNSSTLKNESCDIISEGRIEGIDTNGWDEGTELWLGANGSLTNIEPTAPTPKIYVGVVLRGSSNNGIVYVKIRQIDRLGKLSDVLDEAYSNDDILVYDSSNLRWRKKNLSLVEKVANKGAANGYCPLGADSKVPTGNLPSYVDDTVEGYYKTANGLFYLDSAYTQLITGETGKIYISLDTNKTYRWSGSVYVYITSGAVDSVNNKTGVVVLNPTDIGAAPYVHTHAQYVDNTSNQSVDGIKTFIKSPIVPTPTTATQAVNKDYVDNKVFTDGVTVGQLISSVEAVDDKQTDVEENSLLGASESLNQLFGRIQAIETFLKNAVFETLQVDTLNVIENLNMFKLSNMIKIGTPRLIGFDLTTGGTFTITTGGVTTAPIVYTNTSTFASITAQITDALTAIGKTVALGYQVINGTTYILLRRDYDGLTGYDYTITDASGKIKKTASPLLEPDFIGQFFIDNTSTPAVSWQAVNTTSVSDWKQITN